MNSVPRPFWQKLSHICQQYLRPGSIRGKIFIMFTVTFLSITALTGFNLWNLSMLKTRMLLSERYDDVLNNILEVRRFEKNFLIYADNKSLMESKEYLDRIDTLVAELADDLPVLVGEESFANFQKTLLNYRKLVGNISRGDQIQPEVLRNLGKTLTDAADHFREIKRKRIHATIAQTTILPFAFFAILLSLMALVLWVISHGLLKPLDVVMETTRLVGRGDFRPIHYEGGTAGGDFRLDRGLQSYGARAGGESGKFDSGKKNCSHRYVYSGDCPRIKQSNQQHCTYRGLS